MARRGGRGVVLRRDGPWAVVLTPDGAFRRLRLADAEAEVGAEVDLPAAPAARRLAPWAGGVGAAAAAALVATALGGPPQPRAYVEIAGTRIVRLAVGAQGQVLTAQALDGQALPVPVRVGEPVERAVESLARADGVSAAGLPVGGVVVTVFKARGASVPPGIDRTVQAAAGQAGAVTVSDLVPAAHRPRRHGRHTTRQGLGRVRSGTAALPGEGGGPAQA
jgi:hypothetical protein